MIIPWVIVLVTSIVFGTYFIVRSLYSYYHLYYCIRKQKDCFDDFIDHLSTVSSGTEYSNSTTKGECK